MSAYARTAWRLASRGPGPWLVGLSALGWLLLVGRASSMPHAMAMGHHATHGIADWALMLLAMSPLVVRSDVAWLQRNNLATLRAPAIAIFGLGYALPWLFLGAACLSASDRLARAGPATFAAAAVALLAWHASPMRQRLLNACHRRPGLRAFGMPMVADTARFGIRTGATCSGLCGPAMLLAMASQQGHLAGMAAATAWLTAERYVAPRRPRWRAPWWWRGHAPRWTTYGFAADRAAEA